MLWAGFLFCVGVALIVLEFILPGLICGVVGVGCLAVSTGLAIAAFPQYTVFILIGESLGAIAGCALGLLLLAKTGIGRSLFLNTTQRNEDGYTNMASDLSLIGTTGVVLTALRPSGTIEAHGQRIDAVSDGKFIDAGATVRVTEVHGNRVVVEASTDVNAAAGV